MSCHPVVKQTELGSLCLIKSGGAPRMCVRAVDSSKKSGNFKINFVSKAIKT